ncbi:MAG: TRAP transporter solute receptor, TAXI family precursor, partial [uncultured Craurococcus sp.]
DQPCPPQPARRRRRRPRGPAPGPRRRDPARHRHRHDRRRLLSAGRWPRERPLPHHPRDERDRRGHRRLRRQQPAARRRPGRPDLLAGRCQRRCGEGRGPLPRPPGEGPRHRRPLQQPHAGGDDGRQRHPEPRRPEGQAHLDRRPRLRHRGDGLPPHRGRRPRSRQGFPRPRAPLARREHQRHQGRQARRLFLRLRRADQRGDRPRRLARHHPAADRPCGHHPEDHRQVRPGLLPGGDPGRHLSRPDHGQPADVGGQHPRRARYHAGRAGDEDPGEHLERPGRTRPGACRGARLHPRSAEELGGRRALASGGGGVLEEAGGGARL